VQKKTIILVAAVLAGGLVVVALAYSSSNMAQLSVMDTNDLQAASAVQFCESKEQALAQAGNKVQVKVPSYLPTGYNLICADGTEDVVLLFYGDSKPIEAGKANRDDLIKNGAILVGTKLFNNETDSAYYVKDRKAEIEHLFDGNPQLKTRLTEINGNLAAVREMCKDCGQSILTYQNGTSIQTGGFPLPSVITYYDGDQMYRIEAYKPSQELEKIANSLT